MFVQVWLANWMGKLGHPKGEEIDEEAIRFADRLDETARQEMQAFLDRAEAAGITVLLVSNECGLDLTPHAKVSRYYRDTLGRINQDVARRSASVFLMLAGCAVDIKKLDAQATLLS